MQRFFFFFGQLMGLACRTYEVLSLNLPPLVWKALVGDEPDEQDVLKTDAHAFSLIDTVREIVRGSEMDDVAFEDIKRAIFGDREWYFVAQGADGTERPIVPDGQRVELTYRMCEEYAQALSRFRKTEFRPMIATIRAGLCSVLPPSALGLLTWRELEEKVCGSAVIDLELLKRVAVYKGYSATDKTVQLFWRVLESWSNALRVKFLRFVWARERLLRRADQLRQPFQITKDPNPKHFPTAQTCFFELKLPVCESEEILRERLLFSVTETKAIDADTNRVDMPAEEYAEDD